LVLKPELTEELVNPTLSGKADELEVFRLVRFSDEQNAVLEKLVPLG
jgi:hypothetical protein